MPRKAAEAGRAASARIAAPAARKVRREEIVNWFEFILSTLQETI
jgi:hypothetical protein